MTHRTDTPAKSAQAAQVLQRSTPRAGKATSLKWPRLRSASSLSLHRGCSAALHWGCSVALLAASASAVAQSGSAVGATGTGVTQTVQPLITSSASRLTCQPATITVFPATCPRTNSCGPGDGGPGMSQVTGSPGKGAAVTGAAMAQGLWLATTRTVDFHYSVPDVRAFAPAAYTSQLAPLRTQTWIVKAATVPGPLASNFSKVHSLGDFSTGLAGATTTSSQSAAGRWLLVGQVSAQAVVNGYFKDVTYGFSCDLPVQNPIYQPPPALNP